MKVAHIAVMQGMNFLVEGTWRDRVAEAEGLCPKALDDLVLRPCAKLTKCPFKGVPSREEVISCMFSVP